MGIFGGETVNGDVAEAFAETLGQTEMELADRVGVVSRDFFERTAPENEGHLTAPFAAGRAKATLVQLALEGLDGITLLEMLAPSFEASLTTDFVRTNPVLQGSTK